MTNFLAKLERKIGRFAIKNLTIYVLACYVLGYGLSFIGSANGIDLLGYLTLDPYAIVHGQVWRLLSWLVVPPSQFNIFTIIMLLFYFSIGRSLENTWGTFLYNVYLFSGIIFTVLGSFLMMGYIYIFHNAFFQEAWFSTLSSYFSTYYINLSLFLAFAATFPNNVVYLMFFIPVKVKWLGIAYGVFFIVEMVLGMVGAYKLGASYIYPFTMLPSLLNFAIFFLSSRNYIRLGNAGRQTRNNFRRATKNAGAGASAYRYAGPKIGKHMCAVCGRTDKDDDTLTFRFCSKCKGNYEYCNEHLYTHVHKT